MAAARRPRLSRSRDSRLLHRPAAEGSRLAAGSSRATANSKSPACRTPRTRASWTTCSGATTAGRSAWSRPSGLGATRAPGSSRRSSTPTAWSASSASGRSSSTPTATTTGSGTTPATRRARVQGFYKKAELELLIQRRASRKPLASADINGEIVERYYQTRAIRRIAESFEKDRDRKALLVMATGAGKTRTVIALCDLLMRGQLGQARSLPGRPSRPGQAGGERVQAPPARTRRR